MTRSSKNRAAPRRFAGFVLASLPCLAHASTPSESAQEVLPIWTVLPFATLLLSIAALPLVTPHWWHNHRNQALVSLVLGLPVALWMGQRDLHTFLHTLHEYAAFIILLGSLFVISGGVVVRGTLAGTPIVNTAMLLIGTAAASFVGTTGASMLLIRPILRANAHRTKRVHVIVFFIFLVSNVGGLLTPLGDPPLFLGFLRGVPFTWTLQLLAEWAVTCGVLLLLFFVADSYLFHREGGAALAPAPKSDLSPTPLSIAGMHNFALLFGVVIIIYCSGQFGLPMGVQELGMLAMAGLSLWTTPKTLHQENEFSWAPIVEVVVIFAGIFATMMPALAILNARGGELGLTEPWQYFWASGLLSSFLDNAPTYLTFTSTASGALGTDAANLLELAEHTQGERLLRAISLGSVFMGANTYIGNGPNFMVKAIAEQGGVRMPSFFGYILYSVSILIPLFLMITFIFLL